MKCNSAQSSRIRLGSRNSLNKTRHTLHVVLNWSSSQQQPIPAMEPKQRLPPHTGRVLDILCLIENHILPLDALEVLLILGDELVVGNQDVEGSILVIADLFLAPELSKRCSVFDITPVWESAPSSAPDDTFLFRYAVTATAHPPLKGNPTTSYCRGETRGYGVG